MIPNSKLMGVISNTFNRSFKKFFTISYYGVLKLVLLSALKSKGAHGTTRALGFKVKYTDAFAMLGMYNEIVHQQHYEFKADSDSPTIIDCGSNIGLSLLYFHKLYPNSKLIGVEADPKIAEVLKENLSKNNCAAEIIEKALWSSSDEKLSFGSSGDDSGSLFSEDNTTTVETIGLKELLSQHKQIDLLKIDIEGAELEVIHSSKDLLENVKYMFVEFHSFPGKRQGLEDILKICSEQGFRYKILPAKRVVKPFIHSDQDKAMDLQLNVFFFRI
ncbi:MAG: FkbM family methyltransferase [Crocinitomicaceae bacterium]